MSPRPVEVPKSRFGPAIQSARTGQFASAFRSVEREIAQEADRESIAAAAANALAEIARLSETGGDLDTADRALKLALGIRPRYADLHYQRACVLLAHEHRAEARRELDDAITLNPRYLAARLERALLDAREGRVSDALDSLQTLAPDLPDDQSRTFERGLRSLERAEWDEADALLRRALDLSDPNLKEQLEHLRVHLDRGEAARATEMLREILPGREAYPDLHYLLGVAELAQGHFDDALVALSRALELHPDFHEARVQFARALDCVGASAHARVQLEMVLQYDPQQRDALELRRAWSERAGREHEPAPGTGSRDRQV